MPEHIHDPGLIESKQRINRIYNTLVTHAMSLTPSTWLKCVIWWAKKLLFRHKTPTPYISISPIGKHNAVFQICGFASLTSSLFNFFVVLLLISRLFSLCWAGQSYANGKRLDLQRLVTSFSDLIIACISGMQHQWVNVHNFCRAISHSLRAPIV